MEICLHPRYAPAGLVRVWVGVTDVNSTPTVTWTLDGTAHQPKPLRPLESVRTPGLHDGERRIFSGVYEFGPLPPGTASVEVGVEATEPGRRASHTIDVSLLPPALPEGGR